MADNHTKESRSYNMARIRSKNTKPEEVVRKFLFSKGLRYRKNDKRYPGKPDIVIPKHKTIIFVNGCFWHMHEDCRKFSLPKSNQDYWTPKLMKNKTNDEKNQYLLKENGWKVIVVWGCQLMKQSQTEFLEKLYRDIVDS